MNMFPRRIFQHTHFPRTLTRWPDDVSHTNYAFLLQRLAFKGQGINADYFTVLLIIAADNFASHLKLIFRFASN